MARAWTGVLAPGRENRAGYSLRRCGFTRPSTGGVETSTLGKGSILSKIPLVKTCAHQKFSKERFSLGS